MKTIKKQLIIILSLITLISSCTKEDVSESIFGENDLPKIYMGWPTNQTIEHGRVLKYTPTVSPSDGASYTWTLNNEIISTERMLEHLVTIEPGRYELRFDVVRNERSTYRKATLRVIPARDEDE